MTDISANFNSYYKVITDISFYSTVTLGSDASFTITKDPSYGTIYANDGVTEISIASANPGPHSFNQNYKYKHDGCGNTLDDNVLYDISGVTATASGELYFDFIQPFLFISDISNVVYESSNNILPISSNSPDEYYDMSLVVIKDVSYGILTVSGNDFVYQHSGGVYFEDEFTFKYVDSPSYTDVSSNVTTYNIKLIEPVVYDLSFVIDYDSSLVIEPSTNFYPDNYSQLDYSFDISSTFGSIYFNDVSNNFTFYHTAGDINSNSFQYYLTYELLSGPVDSSSATVSFDICGVNYSPVIDNYYYYTFLNRPETQQLITTEQNNTDGTTIKYLISYDGLIGTSASTLKSTYTINTFTQSIHYEPLEEGADTVTLLTWRYIDGYSTTYSEALALGNVGSTTLYLTINVNELPQRDKYYSSFTTYSTTRLSDQRYNLAYMRYREYLYSTGTNADKAEIIYNALIAARGSLEAYRYNQQSKQLYKKLVAVAVKLSGEYGPLDDLLSQIC